MKTSRWAGLAAGLFLASGSAGALSPLVPPGEPPEVLAGARWAPAEGFRAVAAAGAFLVTGSADGHLRIWDTAGREVRRVDLGSRVDRVAASADGTVVAAGTGGGRVEVVARGSGKTLFLADAKGPVVLLALSPDGRRVLFGTADAPPLAATVGTPPAPLAGVGPARVAAYSPDGRTLALALANGSLRLVGPGAGEVHTFPGRAAEATALAFSNSGAVVAVGTRAGTVTLVDPAAGRVLASYDPGGEVTGVAFAAGGALVLAASAAGGVALFDRADGQRRLGFASNVDCCRSLALLDGGRTVAGAARDEVLRWDLGSGTALTPFVGQPAGAASVALTADGSVAVLGGEDGVVRAVDLQSGLPKPPLLTLAGPAKVALSPDGARVAAGAADGTVEWLELASGRVVRRMRLGQAGVQQVAFSPSGEQLAVLTRDGRATLVDLATAEARPAGQLPGGAGALAFSGNGKLVAFASQDELEIWSLARGTVLRSISFDARVTALAVAPAGNAVLAALADGSGRVVDPVTGKEVRRLSFAAPAAGAVFADQGRTLVVATADAKAQAFDAKTGRQIASFGLPGKPRALSLDTAGTLLAVATADGGVSLYRWPGDALVAELHLGAARFANLVAGKVFREDDGRLVRLKADEHGGLKASPPAASKATLKLSLEVRKTTPASADRAGAVSLVVHDESGGAFWLRLAGAPMPGTLSLIPPAVVPRLAAGEQAKLDAGIAVVPGTAKAPQDVEVPLALWTAAGRGPTVNVRVHVRAPVVRFRLVSLDRAGKSPTVQVEVANQGDAPTGPLVLAPRFFSASKPAGTAPVEQIPDLKPGERVRVGFAAPGAVGKTAQVELTARSTELVGGRWTGELVLRRRSSWALPAEIAGGLLLLLALVLLARRRTGRDPILEQVGRDPTEIRRYALPQVKLVERALTRARRLDEALAGAKLAREKLDRAVAATASPSGAARAFAEALGAKLGEKHAAFDLWAVDLPNLTLRFPSRTELAVLTGAAAEEEKASQLAQAVHAGGTGPAVGLALDLTAGQNGRAALEAVGRLSFVVLGQDELRDLIFADQPAKELERVLVAQRPVAELSPYTIGGGVSDQALFVGREREIRLITDRSLRNFIVVAPRQMGKSSLLKAVERRLAARPEVEVHHLTLFEDDLVVRMARELSQPVPAHSEGFLDLAAGTRKNPKLWMIDEADAFILKDAKNKYPLVQAMRTLSEEGTAAFILAGFWNLYAAAFLNPNNPLRNFGELIRLSPLDRDAARDLATRPMEALGLSYEAPELVERILDETACRGHLVALVCKALIDGLGPTARTFGEKQVERALYRNPELASEFKHWRRDVLGRAAVRAALWGPPVDRGDLRKRLSEAGLEPSTALYAATLDRLELAYTLVPDAQGRLVCPVPLLQRFVEQEEDLGRGLSRDAGDYKVASGA